MVVNLFSNLGNCEIVVAVFALESLSFLYYTTFNEVFGFTSWAFWVFHRKKKVLTILF